MMKISKLLTLQKLITISLIILAVIFLTGCGSSPKAVAERPQYCYTSQTIVTENGERVNSRTQVECTDDQIKRLVQPRLGMADHCGTYTYNMTIGGRYVQRKGISCQILNERGEVVGWEIVNPSGY
jgi:hypothetical protein